MMQDEIAAMMRTQELQRRALRRAKLLQNEAALADEPLSEFDKKAHAAAVNRIKESQLAFERETSPGYWKRLWRALLGR